ncbi:CidA/LrgA family protein [Halomonadaceae bacterium KBTZ08]
MKGSVVAGLALILVFQLAGLALEQIPGMPLPGPISGMILFFVYLVLTGGGHEPENEAARHLLSHMALFYIPAGAGIVTVGALLMQHALGITLALTLGTLVAFLTAAHLMQWLSR